jgi:hypothetical protein
MSSRQVVSATPRQSPHTRKAISVSDWEFEQRLRIAYELVQLLRKAGYTCGQVADGLAPRQRAKVKCINGGAL